VFSAVELSDHLANPSFMCQNSCSTHSPFLLYTKVFKSPSASPSTSRTVLRAYIVSKRGFSNKPWPPNNTSNTPYTFSLSYVPQRFQPTNDVSLHLSHHPPRAKLFNKVFSHNPCLLKHKSKVPWETKR